MTKLRLVYRLTVYYVRMAIIKKLFKSRPQRANYDDPEVVASEVIRFANKLRAMDAKEIGHLLAFAADIRNKLLHDDAEQILQPVYVAENHPAKLDRIEHSLIRHQICQTSTDAANIWLQTVYIARLPSVRMLGRRLWTALEKGLPYVEEQAEEYKKLSRIELNIDGYAQLPDGFSK